MMTIKISVQLLDENTPVWRPTAAEVLGNGLYRLLPVENYDPEDEKWEFLPGTVVRGEEKILYTKGTVLAPVFVAVKA